MGEGSEPAQKPETFVFGRLERPPANLVDSAICKGNWEENFGQLDLRFRDPSCQQLFPLVKVWGIQSVSLSRVGLGRPGIDVSEYHATLLGSETRLRDC
jgi:hypothetical protein